MNVNSLRPKFFRYAGGRPYSGWRTPEGNIWATAETLAEVVQELQGGNLKPLAIELALSAPNEHGLCLMKHAEPALQTGECLEFTRDVDLFPTDYIEAGERCVAVRKDRVSGVVELFMHHYHRRLDDLSNCIAIEPHTCDEWLGCLRLTAASNREQVAA
jgi:hypothetical protein